MKLENLINYSSHDHIIYYGGSFNPWHEGHSECIRKAPKEALKVIIPDHNPHKKTAKRDFRLDEKYIKGLNSNILIYKDFFYQITPNPTYKWLYQVTQYNPKKKHSLLMGHDSYENLHKWYKFQKLIKILDSLYVLDRNNKRRDHLYEDLDVNFLGEHSFENLSSTQLRKNL